MPEILRLASFLQLYIIYLLNVRRLLQFQINISASASSQLTLPQAREDAQGYGLIFNLLHSNNNRPSRYLLL